MTQQPESQEPLNPKRTASPSKPNGEVHCVVTYRSPRGWRRCAPRWLALELALRHGRGGGLRRRRRRGRPTATAIRAEAGSRRRWFGVFYWSGKRIGSGRRSESDRAVAATKFAGSSGPGPTRESRLRGRYEYGKKRKKKRIRHAVFGSRRAVLQRGFDSLNLIITECYYIFLFYYSVKFYFKTVNKISIFSMWSNNFKRLAKNISYKLIV